MITVATQPVCRVRAQCVVRGERVEEQARRQRAPQPRQASAPGCSGSSAGSAMPRTDLAAYRGRRCRERDDHEGQKLSHAGGEEDLEELRRAVDDQRQVDQRHGEHDDVRDDRGACPLVHAREPVREGCGRTTRRTDSRVAIRNVAGSATMKATMNEKLISAIRNLRTREHRDKEEEERRRAERVRLVAVVGEDTWPSRGSRCRTSGWRDP